MLLHSCFPGYSPASLTFFTLTSIDITIIRFRGFLFGILCRHIIFHDDVGKLYNEFLNMDQDESIGMVQEQTLKYLRAFGSYHIKSPSTKLGRPPSKGSPGFNPDLMVMDLVKLRTDNSFKSMIHELKV